MKNSKILALFLALSTPLVAKPTGGVFVKGEGGIAHPSHCEMKIHANDQTVIHWNSFSIDKGERVQFVQPNAQAHVVNHVVSNHLSEIYGTLEANGHVYLINPAGIVIGKEGIIHAAGFIASTFDFTETKEGMLFKGSSRATIENYGTVSTTHGDVFPVGTSKLKPFPPLSPNGSRSFPSKQLSRPSPQWNHYYIRAIQGEVRLWVNGEEVSGGNAAQPATGHICLESEGAPVEFKDIRIRVLP